MAARRRAEELILQGAVAVNGVIVRTPAVCVVPGRDTVTVAGRVVRVEMPHRYWILNKPRGVLTTRRDPGGRRTIYDLLPRAEGPFLIYAGRLDADAEGLILLTDDGDLVQRLTHPSGEIPRVYLAEVVGRLAPRTVERLRGGVLLEDGPARADWAAFLGFREGRSRCRLALSEGRYHEVKRIFEALGHPVRRLRRVGFGPLQLGALPPGRARRLHPREVAALRAAGGLKGPGGVAPEAHSNRSPTEGGRRPWRSPGRRH